MTVMAAIMMVVVIMVIAIMMIDVMTFIMEGHLVSMCIMAIQFVPDGMFTPVGMIPFPIVKTRRPRLVQPQPDMIGS